MTETILTIGKQPLRYPAYEGKRSPRQFRRAPVEKFPYIIVYEVRKEEALIVAVAHTSQEAAYWDRRDEDV